MAKKKAVTKAATKRAPRKAASTKASKRSDVEREIDALNARISKLEGKSVSTAAEADIAWLEKSERADAVQAWIKAVPKGEYCNLARRQHKQIDDAVRNYDLPLDGPTVNLAAVISAFHDFIAGNAHRLRRDLDVEKEELDKKKIAAQIIGIEYDNEGKQIDLLYSKGRAIPKDVVQHALVWLQGALQNLGGNLRRIHPDAGMALNEFLERLAEELESGQLNI